MTANPSFELATQWIGQYRKGINPTSQSEVTIGIQRGDIPVARDTLQIDTSSQQRDQTFKYIERQIKSLLWIHGGNKIQFAGPQPILHALENHYRHAPTGVFDSEIVGEKMFGMPLRMEAANPEDIAPPKMMKKPIGGNLNGCRIGFDLGGSDRKCAATIDGDVVFSEETPWDPYFQKDPQYHYDGIMDSLKRAAKHLPRVDAIGGSAAGVYVDNEVRVASLFRGVQTTEVDTTVRDLFKRVQSAWNDVSFVVINDGEVTALAGAMSLQASGLLGVSMGTSTAAGYVTPDGHLTNWLNELAFVPVDYSDLAPADEWSGDIGCAVQFFSQQGVARLAQELGITYPSEMPMPERLIDVQNRLANGENTAQIIYQAIGQAFGHTLAHWTSFYELQHILILGRVTSGQGGDIILEQARDCLNRNYPELSDQLQMHIPNETMKRHGQAVAAASLPSLPKSS